MAKGRRAEVGDLNLDSVMMPLLPPRDDLPNLSAASHSAPVDERTRGIAQDSPGDIVAHTRMLRRQAAEEERNRAQEALAQAEGDPDAAARLLGISRETLDKWLNPSSRSRSRKGRA
jgi:DNA-binding NtrC family response regulator